MSDLSDLRRSLQAAATLPDLLARACTLAVARCGFDRAIVLAVEGGELSATPVGAIAHDPSDALRRQLLAQPVPLAPGSIEAELIRRAEGFRRSGRCAESVLEDALGLREHVIVPLIPESRVIALLVLDRAEPLVDTPAVDRAELFGHLLSGAIERLVLRTRLDELSSELRHLTASATALALEATSAPVMLTTDFGFGQVFSPPPALPAGAPNAVQALLTTRELEIAGLMARGMSNREIGAELHLAADTVKAHVARMLRKLGASNRVEAVARYLTAQSPRV